MKYLSDLTQINEEKIQIGCVHHMPFDEVHGLGKTVEELEQFGMLVDDIPEPNAPEGMIIAGLFINPNTKEVWYEYEYETLKAEQIMQQQIDELTIALAAILGGAQ